MRCAASASEQITPERLAAWEREPRGIDAGLLARASPTLGWFGLGMPEASGGSGLGLVEVACVSAGVRPRPDSALR